MRTGILVPSPYTPGRFAIRFDVDDDGTTLDAPDHEELSSGSGVVIEVDTTGPNDSVLPMMLRGRVEYDHTPEGRDGGVRRGYVVLLFIAVASKLGGDGKITIPMPLRRLVGKKVQRG